MKRTLYLLLLMLSVVGCQTDMASPAELQQYCNQAPNGLIQSKTVGDYVYQIQFIPMNLQALRSLDKNNINQAVFQKALEQVAGHYYLNLSIQTQNNKPIAQSINEKQNRAFRFGDNKDDFKLSVGEQTFPCVLYHVEPTSIFLNQIKLTLVFRDDFATPSTIFDDDLIFHFDDNFVGNEAVNITIPKQYLNKIPKLKI